MVAEVHLAFSFCIFAEIVTLLVVETDRYYHDYITRLDDDDGHSPEPDVTDAEMFVFLALTIQMNMA
jgi:hypothetical protein